MQNLFKLTMYILVCILYYFYLSSLNAFFLIEEHIRCLTILTNYVELVTIFETYGKVSPLIF